MNTEQAPPTLRERQREQTRQHLLQTAAELIGANGFNATSIDDIAKAAGAGRATVYSYFDTKDAILDEIIQVMWDEADDLYRELGSLPEWTKATIAAWVDGLFKRWANDFRRNSAAAEAGQQRLLNRHSEYLTRYVKGVLGPHWQGRFERREAELRAALVISMVESFMMKQYALDSIGNPDDSRPVMAQAICEILHVTD